MILIAALIGVLAGLGNILFRTVVAAVHDHVFFLEYTFFGIGEGGWHRIFIPLLPMTGMVLLIPLCLAFPGEVNGYRFPHFLRRVNLEDARIPLRTIFLTTLSTALTMGTGGSAGVRGTDCPGGWIAWFTGGKTLAVLR